MENKWNFLNTIKALTAHLRTVDFDAIGNLVYAPKKAYTIFGDADRVK